MTGWRTREASREAEGAGAKRGVCAALRPTEGDEPGDASDPRDARLGLWLRAFGGAFAIALARAVPLRVENDFARGSPATRLFGADEGEMCASASDGDAGVYPLWPEALGWLPAVCPEAEGEAGV